MAYLTVTLFMLFVLFPLWIPIALTVGPKAMAGIRRVRGGITNRPRIPAAPVAKHRPALRHAA